MLVMLEPGTILRLREPVGSEDEPDPYDLVRVVGQSPVQHATDSGSAWAGPEATGFIITPEGGFGPTLDKPLGQLNELYEVHAYPTDPFTGSEIRPENHPRGLPSPEQALAIEARDAQAAPKRPAAPSLQDNVRSPEQVLRQQPPSRAKAAKPKKENEGE